MIGAFFIPSTFLHFTANFTKQFKKHSTQIQIGYFLSIIFSSLSFTPLLIKDVHSYLSFPYWPLAGPAYGIHIIIFCLLITYTLAIIYKEQKNKTGRQKMQLNHLFWGTLIGFIGGLSNYPPLYNIAIPPLGNIFVSLYIFIIVFTIIKYQLMNIQILFQKSLVYTALITLVTTAYFIFIYITEKILQDIIGYDSFSISIFSIIIITLIFIPLKNTTQRFIYKYFFKRNPVQNLDHNQLFHENIIQTEKLKTEALLAQKIAHEIKNPLTAIQTFSEYLPQKLKDVKFLKKFPKIVIPEVNRINILLERLLDFSKPDPSQKEDTNIHQLLESNIQLFERQFEQKNIKIKINLYKEKEYTLYIDPDQIKQAIINIILNALDSMSKGGDLHISTYITKDIPSDMEYFLITFKDTGSGINAEDLPFIFDSFFSQKPSGTGLGLAITQRIIHQNNGKIRAESIKNFGTTFFFEFPLR